MNVLLVDDERTFAANVAKYLHMEGYDVTVARDGAEGLDLALRGQWGLIILDLNLPKMDGFAVCQRIRESALTTPILMLTARTGSSHVVRGLDCGADDYLTKPFDLPVLLARMRALTRRDAPMRAPSLTVGDVFIDTNSHSVTRNGDPVHLAPREYALLEYLARRPGIVQDRVSILETVWGEQGDALFSQTVDVHVSYLRKKLGSEIITTVPGVGYLVPEEQ
jgi:two-component system OmpR family response regulator